MKKHGVNFASGQSSTSRTNPGGYRDATYQHRRDVHQQTQGRQDLQPVYPEQSARVEGLISPACSTLGEHLETCLMRAK